jgi:hypothetical protein
MGSRGASTELEALGDLSRQEKQQEEEDPKEAEERMHWTGEAEEI